jgi:hypothetical protein
LTITIEPDPHQHVTAERFREAQAFAHAGRIDVGAHLPIGQESDDLVDKR